MPSQQTVKVRDRSSRVGNFPKDDLSTHKKTQKRKMLIIGTSTRVVEVGATGDAACAATTDCDITTTNKLTNYQADGTSSLMGVNKCREEDDGTCALSFPTGYVDDCISSGFLSSDYESVSGANFVAPTVAAVLFSASLLIFD